MKLLLVGILAIIVLSPPKSFALHADTDIVSLYQSIEYADLDMPDLDLFTIGIMGYQQIRDSNQLSDREIITLIDFRKPSTEKRLWVIDIKNKRVLHYSLVAHGQKSGELYATEFSNTNNSNQSSLGFYVTGTTYTGKHGLSLKLHGIEQGINDNAETRAIVMHGADYVSDSFIHRVGRLGRSFGCPAVPMDTYKEIIKQIANGTCLFIYYPDRNYLSRTGLVRNPDYAKAPVGQ